MTQASNLAKGGSNFNSTGNLSLTTGVTGTLPVANGGTGGTTSTGSGALVLATSPTLVTPALGTPSSGALTNCTSVPVNQATGTLPVANGGTGLATLTANNVLIGNGTGNVAFVAPGSNGNILTSNGTAWTSTAPAGGGVTSAVAGNGIAVSGATGAVTFSAACPSFNSIGSYAYAITNGNGTQVSATITAGSNYSAGAGQNQVQTFVAYLNNDTQNYTGVAGGTALSGTWKWMGGTVSISSANWPSIIAIACRVS